MPENFRHQHSKDSLVIKRNMATVKDRSECCGPWLLGLLAYELQYMLLEPYCLDDIAGVHYQLLCELWGVFTQQF